MEHIDLFSGIGGFALAAKWTGIETVAFCEKDIFCQKVLKKNFMNIPIYPDIHTFPIGEYETKTIDFITGGIPCQPFSIAGHKRGKQDDRYLWKEMFRIIQGILPTWAIIENVTGIIDMALEEVCVDLENTEYEVQPFIIPACSVNAPHQRNRVWLIARLSENSMRKRFRRRSNENNKKCQRALQTKGPNPSFSSNAKSSDRQCPRDTWDGRARFTNSNWNEHWLQAAARLCRMDAWVSSRMDRHRLKSLGNSIVPQIAAIIFNSILNLND